MFTCIHKRDINQNEKKSHVLPITLSKTNMLDACILGLWGNNYFHSLQIGSGIRSKEGN